MADSFLVKKGRRLYIIGFDAPHIKRFLQKAKTVSDQHSYLFTRGCIKNNNDKRFKYSEVELNYLGSEFFYKGNH